MNPPSPEHIEHYRRDGYVIVADLLTDAEIDRFVAYEAEAKPGSPTHKTA